MILVWGVPRDSPVRAVLEALEEIRQPFFFLDQHDVLGSEMEMSVDCNVRGVLRSRDCEVDLSLLTAAYLRPYDSRRLPAVVEGDRPAADRAAAFDDAVLCWSEVTEARVVSRPSAMASNQSKPYQSRFIRDHGFLVPETLLTTDAHVLEEFWERHGDVIYKSLSSVRSIVSLLTPAHRSRLVNLSSCPTQFQQWIPGVDVRVHVVGSGVFAAQIESAAEDYRYPRKPHETPDIKPIVLPEQIANRCRSLAAALRLPVAGVDLRRTPAGEWYCFEVNPSPAFTYYEEATGQRIAKAVAALLAGSEGT